MLPDITSQKVSLPSALFLALSPGIILRTDGSRVSFGDGLTGRTAVFFHALVFLIAFSLDFEGDRSRSHANGSHRHHDLIHGVESGYASY